MNKNRQKLSVNSFFAGIGGFDLAFEQEGIQTTFQCEVNEFCLSILSQHWPNVKQHTDIMQLGPQDIPEATIWCGGFPCQDVSVARGAKGRQGLKGKNSGLFYPYFELIKAKLPKVVLIENVTGLLSSHNGQDFRVIIESLSSLGYTVCWRVMNSRFYGAPQSRPRVFICASLSDPFLAISVLYENKKGSQVKGLRNAFMNVSKCDVTGAKVADISYCLAATSGRHTGTDWSRTYVSYDSSVRRLTPTECEGVQGFPTDWTLPKEGRSFKDIDSDRYHALGNAVSVPVVRWIAKNLKDYYSINGEKTIKTKFSGNENFLFDIEENFNDFIISKARIQCLQDLHFDVNLTKDKLKWKSGGIVHNGYCLDINVSEAPSTPIQVKLINVIEKNEVDDKYYISANAAEGILRRVTNQNRTLFAPLHNALIKLCNKKNVA
ncbi:TPA: DNA (cytosine-5-)-methyltransferase [Klebsiella quasipneumoniae]|uniref:DNA cytosine methyltransferase n=1 Tax=Klebsiella quasipneumoniae TaxID=1463165 RepID=UPI00193AA27A|nr:DNA (cytosine-5-)-methyltransferase [Klebsiella quasipneumoniae]HBT0543238.1 DNA (cytosine-5-)-methyltransferase [Klebsiella pneumoniae]MBM0926948.1 DNA (cytosine-5-)-methyltransferase [Klebsiella quasipneumoniae]MCU8814721.1 DNA (cytosine-5-)-methyltransferase [Klebsiella quasipneumoniae]HBT5872160.1 DNA (cytosine-5-)-methyltransferase [Klebsiella quasipneumoniae]HBT5984304.1 DNA (cytosine-5-)-methyltransferase [Klebsiella quasipneumoniae]